MDRKQHIVELSEDMVTNKTDPMTFTTAYPGTDIIPNGRRVMCVVSELDQWQTCRPGMEGKSESQRELFHNELDYYNEFYDSRQHVSQKHNANDFTKYLYEKLAKGSNFGRFV